MEELKPELFVDTEDPINKFNEILMSIADRCIPKTSACPKKPSKPWFNDDCDKAIGDRNKALRNFDKHPTQQNLNNYRIFRAKARRTCKQARRTSWQKFVSSMNSHTPMNKVWNFIQKKIYCETFKGKNWRVPRWQGNALGGESPYLGHNTEKHLGTVFEECHTST